MVNKTTLKNGIRIVTRHIPHVRSVCMGVWVHVGARDESPEENGLSHFVEHMIFKGTRKRNAFEIAKAFDAIGGQTNAFTATETTCYHARVLDAHIGTMVDILSDIFLNSVFDPREMERERGVILQEMAMLEDSPEDTLHMLAEKFHWAENSLGQPVIGTRENLMRFDDAGLKHFFRRLYQPDRIVISAAGNLLNNSRQSGDSREAHDRLVEMMAPAFETIKSGNGFPERVRPAGNTGCIIQPKDLNQTHICLGMNGMAITDPDRYTAALLNTILGGNMSSRLFQEIRERRGLAYSVYSFMSSYVDAGMSGVYVGTDDQKAVEALEQVLAILKAFREEPVDAGTLADAKEFTRAGLLMASESVDGQMVRLAQNEIHLGKYLPMDKILDKMQQITAEEIRELACNLFQPEPVTLAVLGASPDEDRLNACLEIL